MSYASRSLIAGEAVRYETGIHWMILFWPLFFALAVVIYAGAMDDTSMVPLLSLFVIGWLIYAVIKKLSVEMAVTNRRIIIKTGVFNTRFMELLLVKVESIVIEQDLTGRVMGYGKLVVKGTGGSPESFRFVRRPFDFREQVQSAVEGAPKSASSQVNRFCTDCGTPTLGRFCSGCGRQIA